MSTNSAGSLPSREAGLSLLDHLHAAVAGRCSNIGSNAPTLMVVDRAKKQSIFFQADCKMWSCESCGARKASQWIARIIQGIQYYGGQWFFMTITAHQNWRGEERSLENLRQGWRKLYNRFRRRFGKFHYIKIYEHHKDGSLHLHLLTDLLLPYKQTRRKSKEISKRSLMTRSKYLKDTSAKCGMGYMCDYQPIANAGIAAWYVAKYLGKSIGVADFPSNLRRIQASHKFHKLPPLITDESLSYLLVRNRTDMLLKAYNLLRTEDILTYDAISEKDVTTDDWEGVI